MSPQPGIDAAPDAAPAIAGAVARLRARVGRALALRGALRALAVGLGAWGVTLLALRAGVGTAGPGLAWAVAVALPIAVTAGVHGWRRRPAREALCARLDELAGGSGLLLLADEAGGVVPWAARVPPLPRARIRRRDGRWLAGTVAAAAFVVTASRVPIDASPQEGALDLTRPAAALEAQADALRELAAIEEETARRWQEQLGEAGDLAAAGEAERAWQALDAVAEGVEEASRAAADAALAEADRLARAADALSAEAGEDAPLATAAQGALAGTGEDDAGSGDAATARAAAGGAGDPAARAALAARLRADANLRRQLAAALRSGAVDLDALRRAGGLAPRDERSLAERLASGEGEGQPGSDPTALGRGGVDRGRGDAPYLVKEAAHDYGVGFEDHALSPAALSALDSSVVLATDAARPPGDGAASPAGGALDRAAAAPGAAFTQLVLPRHRAAVRRYFARPE